MSNYALLLLITLVTLVRLVETAAIVVVVISVRLIVMLRIIITLIRRSGKKTSVVNRLVSLDTTKEATILYTDTLIIEATISVSNYI